jgi:predicted nucleic acid-binding protein
VILDTSYLGDLVERDPNAVALSEELDSSGKPRRLPAAVVWELFYGLGKTSDSTGLRRRYSALLGGTIPLDLDDSAARRAGTLRGKHTASDGPSELDGADSVVAAHGLALDEPVVAADDDFERVEGLDVLTY